MEPARYPYINACTVQVFCLPKEDWEETAADIACSVAVINVLIWLQPNSMNISTYLHC